LEREKRIISEDLGMQQEAYEIISRSKKQNEKRMEIFKDATAQDRNEIEKKALEEFLFLRDKLKAMELQLMAKEEIAKNVQVLEIEKKKMQGKIDELNHQNFSLKYKVGEIQQRFDWQKQQNDMIIAELEDMKMQNTWSLMQKPQKPNACDSILIKVGSTEVSSPLSVSKHFTPFSEHAATTPTPICFFQDVEERYNVIPYSKRFEDEQYDPLDEYINLSITAAKIRFPEVKVSREKLREKAKSAPFYNIHDVLSRYMEEMQTRQQTTTLLNPRGQAKPKVEQLSVLTQQTSIFGKARKFLGCGTILEESGVDQEEPYVGLVSKEINNRGIAVDF